MPSVTAADGWKVSSLSLTGGLLLAWSRFAGATERELRSDRADDLEYRHRGEHDRCQLSPEARIEGNRVAHHHHRKPRHGHERHGEQAYVAGRNARGLAEDQQTERLAEEPHDDERRHGSGGGRSEEHTSELQSHHELVCRLLLE